LSILTGERIKLRAMEPADADLLYGWENNPDVWPVSNTLAPYSRFVLEKYIAESHMDIFQTRQLRLMIDLSEAGKTGTIGAIDLFDFEPLHRRAGIGILISEKKNMNRGYASEALELLINYSFSVLQLHQLFCHIDHDNKVSIRLFEKFGFEITGQKKDWNKTPAGWKNVFILQLINPVA
jgi:diamine N-acetyltransferase